MSENGDAHGSHADPGATGAERELPANPEEALKLAKDHGWQEQLPDSVAAESGHFSGDWFSNPVTYEYDGEAGDIGPEVPALEQQLFSTDLRQIKGDHLSVYAVEVDTEGPEKPRAIMKVSQARRVTSIDLD